MKWADREMVRSMGFPYIELEKMGVVMPVYFLESKYRNVITYDELITIETTVKELPTAKIRFHRRIFNEDGTLAHEATVVLVFMDMRATKDWSGPRSAHWRFQIG